MKIELLAPAGNLEKLKTAIHFGADAIYLGGKAFNLRSASHNFSNQNLEAAVTTAHAAHKKIYVTLNILAHEREIKALPQFIRYLDSLKIDGVIVADLGVLDLVREHSDLPIHISTQASTTNHRAAKVWQKLGATRIVLAREVSIDEIKRIKDQLPDMELEVFIHGSMCMTYSGRCQLSRYFAERDGNRGACANTCRWKFQIVEEKRPGEYFPVYEDDTGSYIYNSKDLCTIEFIDKIIESGVSSLKIEGRMKTSFYCGMTTKIYREAIDSYLTGSYAYQKSWRKDLEKVAHRGYTSGFFLGRLDAQSESLDGGRYGTHKFAAIALESSNESGQALVNVREKICLEGSLEVLRPNTSSFEAKVLNIFSKDKLEAKGLAQPNEVVYLELSTPLQAGDLLICKNNHTNQAELNHNQPIFEAALEQSPDL